MNTASDPKITHPAWCSRDICWEDRLNGELYSVSHATEKVVRTLGTCGDLNAEVYMYAVEGHADDGEPPRAYLSLGGGDELSFDDLERLGLWLIEQAAALRSIVEPATFAPTLLDEDLGLEVREVGDAVEFRGEPSPDGSWQFTADDARGLALALLRHAVGTETVQ